MLLKLSFLVVAPFAAFAVSSQTNGKSKSTRKQYTITKIQDGSFMDSGKVEEEDKPEISNIREEDKKAAETIRSKTWNTATEAELLRDLTRDLGNRKVTLEWKLLELHGLKEERAYVAQLQRHLKEKSAEIDMLNIALGSLEAENKGLKEEIKQGFLVKKQLELATKMIAEMQRKIDVNARNVKRNVLLIEEKVNGIQEEENPERDALIEQKLKAASSIELEVVKMRRRNKEVELEKRELTVKLLAAQAKITKLSHMTEDKIMSKLEDEISILRCGNEELSRQIERLQRDRFSMVEELVYQRWLLSCLRFEIQNKGNPQTETSKDSLKNHPFLNFDEKIKSPVSYPSSSYSISSNTSSSTESDQVESTIIRSSSSSQNSMTSKSPSFMQKIKSFGRCKDDSSVVALLAEKRRNSKSRRGLIRRFSTSMVPVNSSTRRNKGESAIITSPTKPSCPRVRRVSFNDSVMTHNVASSVEIQSASDENSSHKLGIGFEGNENPEEIKPEASLVSGGNSSDTRLEPVEGYSKSEIAGSKENNDEDRMGYLFVVLFFFLFIFLADYNKISQNLRIDSRHVNLCNYFSYFVLLYIAYL